MILKNVKTDWLFINRPDDNGNYRVTFTVTKEQDAELVAAMETLAQENGVKLKDCDWQGSRKEENGVIQYSAKTSRVITLKKTGETKEVDLPVYNVKAQLLKPEEVPSVKNGAITNVSIEGYFAKYKQKKGVMLGLRSIQLISYEIYEGDNPFTDESGKSDFGNESEDLFK